MRGKACTRLDRRGDLHGVRGSVPQRYKGTGLDDVSDISRGIDPMRRKGDQFNQTTRSLLPAIKFRRGGRTYFRRRMSPTWTIFSRDMRPLDMHPGNHVRDLRVRLTGSPNHP